MTILQLISSEGYYGIESMLVSLGKALSDAGWESIVGVIQNSQSPHTEVATEAQRRGLKVEIVLCEGRWDWNTIAHIRRLLDTHNVDVIQPHGYKANIFSACAAWRKPTALVATVHNWTNQDVSSRTYYAVELLALRCFDCIATPSEVVAATLRSSGLPSKRIATIGNGVDVAAFSSGKPVLRRVFPNRRLVGVVGRLVREKGGESLLHAAKKVLRQVPNATFLFIGGGPARDEWERIAQDLGIAGNVVFTGIRRDMPDVYASLDLVVLPSFVEAMPMCLLEALAAGRPVIATNVGAVPNVVVDQETGLLIQPGDVDAMAAGMVRLLQNRDLAATLGSQGRDHVIRNFSAEATARSYMREYERILAVRSRSARIQPDCRESGT